MEAGSILLFYMQMQAFRAVCGCFIALSDDPLRPADSRGGKGRRISLEITV